MVNLRGAFRGLGEALTTIGTQGIAEQQRIAADARLMAREQALASLNQTIRNQDADTAVKRGLSEYDAQTPLVAGRRQKELAVQEPYQVAAEGRAQERTQENRAADNQEWTRRQQVEFDRWRQQHGIEEDTARSRALWMHEQGLDASSRPDRYLEDGETNTYVAQYADGHTEDTGVRLRPRANEDDDGVGADRPAPAAPARDGGRHWQRMGNGTLAARTNGNPGEAPIAGARQAPDGNWYIQRNGRTYRVDR